MSVFVASVITFYLEILRWEMFDAMKGRIIEGKHFDSEIQNRAVSQSLANY